MKNKIPITLFATPIRRANRKKAYVIVRAKTFGKKYKYSETMAKLDSIDMAWKDFTNQIEEELSHSL